MTPDYLALCPLCRRPVSILSRRLAHLARAKERASIMREHPEWAVGAEVSAESILAKWVKSGLVVELVQPGQPLPATDELGHTADCRFGWVLCTFPGCEKRHVAHGLCAGHYQQRLTGKPLTTLRRQRPKKRSA
jgi:hypothetical protein